MEVERVVALVALVALVVVYGKCMGILWYLCIYTWMCRILLVSGLEPIFSDSGNMAITHLLAGMDPRVCMYGRTRAHNFCFYCRKRIDVIEPL